MNATRSGALFVSSVVLLGALGQTGCGDSAGGAGGSGGATQASSTSGVTTKAVAVSSSSSSSSTGAGGFPEYIPTAADIQFAAVNKIPSGEQLLFNDWTSMPNSVWAMTPDGQTLVEVFRAFRVWSMGASHASHQIAFACGDPNQEAHFGINVGDAIQHTFVYDEVAQTVKLVAHGNINDECHTFSADDQSLYVCRRYDFDTMGGSKNYRIGKIDVATAAFDFVMPESASTLALYPQPTSDGLDILYTEVPVPSGDRTILRRTLSSSTEVVLKSKANAPVLSPDGLRYLYVDNADAGALHAADLSGANDVKVLSGSGASSVRYSPDGSRVAYLVFDNAKNCSHIEIVKADGSEANAPTRVYDCGVKGRFITELAWVVAP